MTRHSADPGLPTRALTVQETAEVGRLVCQLLQRQPVMEGYEIARILATVGHGGCQTAVEKMLQREREALK